MVPDLRGVMTTVVGKNLDIEDVLYVSPGGPITVRDVIYGWGAEIARSGHDYYAHKTGFTESSLRAALYVAGFPFVFTRAGNLEVQAIAFSAPPARYALELFELPTV